MRFPDADAAEAAFYSAFRELDLEKMRAVWLDSSTISCIHPGAGLLLGADAVLASWAEIFANSQAPQVDHRLIQASTDEHLAVHTVEEKISSGPGMGGALVVATNVYRRVGGGWYMQAHHATLPLVEPKRKRRTSSLH